MFICFPIYQLKPQLFIQSYFQKFIYYDSKLFNSNFKGDLMCRVLANRPGEWSSIPGRVKPKIQKRVLDAFLLNSQHYKVQIKCKVEHPGNVVVAFPSHRCSSY